MDRLDALAVFDLEKLQSARELKTVFETIKGNLAIREMKGEDVTEEKQVLLAAYDILKKELSDHIGTNGDTALQVVPRSSQNMVMAQPVAPIVVASPQLDAGEYNYLPPKIEIIDCPHCGEVNPVEATTCLSCGQQISRPCPQCGTAIPLSIVQCYRCKTIIKEYDRTRFAKAAAIQKKVAEDRVELDAHVATNEEKNQRYFRFGVAFWIVAFLLSAVLCYLAIYLINNY